MLLRVLQKSIAIMEATSGPVKISKGHAGVTALHDMIGKPMRQNLASTTEASCFFF